MSFQVLEEGGPMRLKYLSDLRRTALLNIVEGAHLPGPFIDYLIALETAYLSQENERTLKFIEKSWEQFR